MEHANPKYFACTEPIDIKGYFKKYAKELDFINEHETIQIIPNRNEETVNFLDVTVTASKYEQLSEICSLDKLKHADEVHQTSFKDKLAKPSNLLLPDVTGSHLKILKAKEKWENSIELKAPILSYPIEREEKDTLAEDLIPNKDVIVVVRFYKPFKVRASTQNNNARLTHEIAVLASHTLADLRDMLKCVNDYGSSIEIQHPDDVVPVDIKEEYPSGFIFIEDCFYNDMRHPNAIEYSKEVIEWAHKKNIQNYKTAKMENTKIMDMKIRIGYPYLYQHQANCQHLVVFSDMRLLRQDELRMTTRYPYVLAHQKFNRRTCMMCTHLIAEYVVTDCDRLLAKFNYLCKKCLIIYNYKDGQKIGNFKLFYYYDINLTFQ